MRVAVLDTNRKQLAPATPRRARLLLDKGRAAVFRRYPFTLILKREVPDPETPELRIKIDPGSKKTGIAVVNQQSGAVVFAAEVEHRGQAIKSKLDARRSIRRNRRSRKTRYRQPRFLNRTRPKTWLPPSFQSRVCNIETWVRRLNAVYPLSGISLELVKFDTQLMQNPEIEGVEYQQGELAGYELREYLLCKWGHRCVYGGCTDVPLEIEHIIPRSRGGSNRASNLTLACRKHNQEKGNRTAAEYGFPEIEAQAKQPLRDAAAMNATRWRLFERLKAFHLPIETGSGGLTKFNRTGRGLPKTHWIDAACVGKSTPARIKIEGVNALSIKARGHNSRQMTRVDKYGFPRTSAKGSRNVQGFKTGDIMKAIVTKGKKAGVYVGRVAIRSSGSFNVTTKNGTVQGINWRNCRRLHRTDGYSY
ncbi:MAG: RNA-guided endonuclease IscB [Acidobacteria bacterium]|nr:RNA-guided endonuclease IscB [Acidobacteriota bacterium]